MDGKGGFQVQEGGWEEYTTMVYVDQPAGTGFSYTSTDKFVHNFQQASDQFLEFLKNFYKVFPEYEHVDVRCIKFVSRPTQHSSRLTWLAKVMQDNTSPSSVRLVPALQVTSCNPELADALLNSKVSPLKGIAIGNGWIDARSQYPSYIDYLVKTEVLEENSDVRRRAFPVAFLTCHVPVLESSPTKDRRMFGYTERHHR